MLGVSERGHLVPQSKAGGYPHAVRTRRSQGGSENRLPRKGLRRYDIQYGLVRKILDISANRPTVTVCVVAKIQIRPPISPLSLLREELESDQRCGLEMGIGAGNDRPCTEMKGLLDTQVESPAR